MSAKMYGKLGTMEAGKSLELLKTADTYERKGRKVSIIKPFTDTRYGSCIVKSRVGLEKPAVDFDSNDYRGITQFIALEKPDIVLIDEAQFFSKKVIECLARGVVDMLDIPVICFGLKNNFKNELFEGSAAILALADDISEIKGICEYCNRKAIMNLRTVNGKAVYSGDEVQIGDEEYKSVCRKHYYL
ncbi:thymidine kinase [Bacillus cereus]|uniref:thymidine kinase n=1 Tax=Bacillus cereus TaxID=1396 RepID=UPI001F10D3A8|nr:thymidine kinase [Bacillus cereus]MCH5476747.1 thymidine kinase [Bacillus cereus]